MVQSSQSAVAREKSKDRRCHLPANLRSHGGWARNFGGTCHDSGRRSVPPALSTP